ncbi:hypothetical protein, partial [Protofrankia symbiont of Coriaria ruscifolia]|uniref:hypothetical protein n=1 Tax=Protofrankia symbiont of Coriaria ruscifolia TaxID=1306542 RepID=UPI0010418307
MLTAFWETAGSKLTDRWAAVSAPALLFWLGGLAAWTHHHGGLRTLDTHTGWLDRQTPAVQTATILTALLTITASGIVVDRLTTPTLRLLEGYWPSWTGPLRRRLTDTLARRAAADAAAWQQAYSRIHTAAPTAADLAVYTRLDRRRRRRPASAGYFLPTPIGNILRAAERRPVDKYGLDTVTVWPHLWLLLPEDTRTALRAARASLDTAVATALWGVLFCAFTPLTWLALPVGLTVTGLAVAVVIPARAQVFGDLIETAYDLHRTAVYQQLRWPLPASPHHEREHGQRPAELLV